MKKEYLSVSETARFLRIGRNRVWKMIFERKSKFQNAKKIGNYWFIPTIEVTKEKERRRNFNKIK